MVCFLVEYYLQSRIIERSNNTSQRWRTSYVASYSEGSKIGTVYCNRHQKQNDTVSGDNRIAFPPSVGIHRYFTIITINRKSY